MSEPITQHARDRAAERMGLIASAADWESARMAIILSAAGESRTAMLLKVLGGGVERWAVPVAGRTMMVVYRPDQALIVTVLDPVGAVVRRQQPRVQNARGRTRRERATPEDWG